MQTDPVGVAVDPAIVLAVLAREAVQRAADQAQARKAVADYLATERHPLNHVQVHLTSAQLAETVAELTRPHGLRSAVFPIGAARPTL